MGVALVVVGGRGEAAPGPAGTGSGRHGYTPAEKKCKRIPPVWGDSWPSARLDGEMANDLSPLLLQMADFLLRRP